MNSTNNRQVAAEQLTFWERLDAKAGEWVATFTGAYADPVERGVNGEQPRYIEPNPSMSLIAIPNSSVAFVANNNVPRKAAQAVVSPDLDQLVCTD